MTHQPDRQSKKNERNALVYAFVLVLLVTVAYAGTLRHPFVFDDIRTIVQNTRLHDLDNAGEILRKSRRPVVDLSLALNCTLAGCSRTDRPLPTWSFHLVNAVIHAMSALVLFGLVRRTLCKAATDHRLLSASGGLAFFVAALWALHPIQTESVTYTIQRAESLMGLFYFLTIYCLLRGAESGRTAMAWYGATVVACALGMGSKGVMVTAPIVAILYDRAFLAGSFARALRLRWTLHSLLFATIGVLVSAGVVRGVLGLNPATTGPRTVGFLFEDVSPLEYFQTQPQIILHYLRLLFVPVGQCLDYSWPVERSGVVIALTTVVVAGLGAMSAWGLFRNKWWGFLGAMFFVVLGPTSSFIPIKDLAFEHRMYVPSAGIIGALVIAAWLLWPRLGRRLGRGTPDMLLPVIGVLLVLVSVGLTMHRNRVYANEAALWRDVIAKRPSSLRAHVNLARYLGPAGENDEALRVLDRALEIDPTNAEAKHNLGNILLNLKRTSSAIDVFAEVIEENPDEWRFWYSYARALGAGNEYETALDWYRRVTEKMDQAQLAPGHPDELIMYRAHKGAASCAVRLNRFDDAIPMYQGAIAMRPEAVSERIDLGATYLAMQRWSDAEAILIEALLIEPQNQTALFNLAFCYEKQERLEEAEMGYRRILQLNPQHPQALAQLRSLLARRQAQSAPAGDP